MAIRGAAQTLEAGRGGELERRQLLEAIIDASEDLEQISLEPERRTAAERGLEPSPQVNVRVASKN